MEKLELKHLAAYLPYGLKVSSIHTLNAQNGIGNINHVIKAVNDGKSQYKPILRPLSDITKEIEHDGEKFVFMSKIKESQHHLFFREDIENPILSIQYSEMQKLLSWHFDVFGLIEKGLAIDINTLNEGV